FRLAGVILPLLPERFSYWLFTHIGDLIHRLNRRARETVRDNLRHVLGPTVSEQTLREAVRGVFRTQAKNYFDLFRVLKLTEAEVERRVKVEGWENIEKGLARGKGLIVASAHVGNFDVVMQILAFRRVPTVLVMEHIQPEEVFQYVRALRSDKGIEVVPVEGAARVVMRALREGKLVGLALDWDVSEGVVVPFFGAPARVPASYAELARHTGASISVGFLTRRPDNTYLVQIEPPFTVPKTADRQQDVHETVTRALAIAERYIRAYPEQWVMFHRIWNE
ncbi:MAG: hypothetical protein A2Z04_06205, partial [Chloroflexi bacterium RBG_16_57_9]